jgi:hypothetical protein
VEREDANLLDALPNKKRGFFGGSINYCANLKTA